MDFTHPANQRVEMKKREMNTWTLLENSKKAVEDECDNENNCSC